VVPENVIKEPTIWVIWHELFMPGHSNSKGEWGFKGPKKVLIKTGILRGFKQKTKSENNTKNYTKTTKTPEERYGYFSWDNT